MDYSSMYQEIFSEYAKMSTPALIVSIIVAIIIIVAEWKIFVKAGVPGWACLIPFYSTYKLFEITWGNGWKFLLLLIPIANIVFLIMTEIYLAKSFGKGGGFACGLIFLSVIFYPILGFGSSEYLGAYGAKA